MKPLDIAGQRFGRLIAVERVAVDWSRERQWYCVCDCGTVIYTNAPLLTRGNKRSCGCLAREANTNRFKTHGMHSTLTYKRWVAMKGRCCTPGAANTYYGRLGVCQEWQDSFEVFLRDVGECPGPEMTLDRIDNLRGYEPGNVRWATKVQQGRNKRSNRLITYNGETRCLSEWGEKLGIPPLRIAERLKRGWTLERAMSV